MSLVLASVAPPGAGKTRRAKKMDILNARYPRYNFLYRGYRAFLLGLYHLNYWGQQAATAGKKETFLGTATEEEGK